jgi:putative hydrolase of HD superfamily
MTAMYLAPHFPKLDVNLLIKYALVHDLVEVHAGDTYVFATEDVLSTKAEREAAAQQKLAKEWNDFPIMNTLIEQYEMKADKETSFIYALDKLMPVMQIFINEGYTWKQERLTLDKLHKHKKDKVSNSPEILFYYDQLIDLLKANPELIR